MSVPPSNNSCDLPETPSYESGLPLLSVRKVARKFSEQTDSGGLQDIGFTMSEKEITAIIGRSGSGKSTLLRLIYGLSEPDEGEIRFNGYRVLGPSEQLVPGHPEMRMVSQGFDDLNTFATVYDNVASRLSNEDLEYKNKRTLEVLISLRIDHLRDQRISDLSGGEKQRAAIARALVTQPLLLLMDEPFNQVDAAFRDQLQRDLKAIVETSGLSVIIVSHDPAEVLGMADQLVILNDGKLAAVDHPVSLYHCPPTRYIARMLAKSNILRGDQVATLQIEQQHECYAIHPEWIRVELDDDGSFYIDAVFFRGFYEELLVRNEQIYLRVYQKVGSGLKKGDKVVCHINNYIAVRDDRNE